MKQSQGIHDKNNTSLFPEEIYLNDIYIYIYAYV